MLEGYEVDVGESIYDFRLDVDHCCCRYDDFVADDVEDVVAQVNLQAMLKRRNQIVELNAQYTLRLLEG